MSDPHRRYVYAVQRESDGLYYQNHGGHTVWVPLANAKIMSKGAATSVSRRKANAFELPEDREHPLQVVRFLLVRASVPEVLRGEAP